MYKHITKEGKEFDELALILSENVDVIYCDTETTGLDCRGDKLLTFQVMANKQIFIYDFLHLNKEHLKYLINLINSTGTTAVFHNAKFDWKFLFHNSGIGIKKVFDTMNCEVLINAGVGKSFYSLNDLAKKYLGFEINKETRDEFFTRKVESLTNQMLTYSAEDVRILEGIYKKQVELVAQAKETKVLELEMDLVPVVAKMEYDGVLLDIDKWATLANSKKVQLDEADKQLKLSLIDSIDYSTYENGLLAFDAIGIKDSERTNSKGKKMKFNKAEKEALSLIKNPEDIRVAVNRYVNMGSHDQLKNILNLVGVPIPNTNEKTMMKFADEYEFIAKILEFREAEKSFSTYGFNIIEQIHPISGRIHTDFLNMGAATGRFSSTNPNLQNIPTAEGYRESFIAPKDWSWLSLDYSQQEYRLAGATSREQKIIDAYLAGADMHTATASILYNKPFAEITKAERNRGKTVNFAILYGSSEYGLKRNLGISIEEALNIINTFNSGYPRLYAFKKSAEDMIVKLGYSSTPLGRRRYNVEKPLYMNSFEYMRYESRIKREGFNHIIQGGGADIVKIAMVNIYNNNPFGDKLKMLIQVHDEINLEAHNSIAKDAEEFVKDEMLKAEQPFLGDIPAKVDSKSGQFWIH